MQGGMNPTRYSLLQRVGIVVLGMSVLSFGCSLFNREGPTVTCQDLGNGTTNACKDGIVATCSTGKIRYTVCDDKNACDGTWQTGGRYRCAERDTIPDSTGDGGQPRRPSDAAACDPGGICVIGTTGDPSGEGEIRGFTLDGSLAYFTNGGSVWSVAKAGGSSTQIASKLNFTPASAASISVNDGFVYLGAQPGIVRVPKGGGASTPIATIPLGELRSFAVDDANVYWIEDSGKTVRRGSKLGGESGVTLASGITWDNSNGNSLGRLSIVGSNLYWVTYEFAYRLPKDGASPTSPSVLTLLPGAVDFALDTSTVFFSTKPNDGTSSVIGQAPLVGGPATPMVSNLRGAGSIAATETTVYFVTYEGTRSGISRVPKDGIGGPTVVVPIRNAELGRIIVDETSVYWAEGDKLFRAPR